MIRLSAQTNSRQTSSVWSVDALSQITSSMCRWSWASTDRTTSPIRLAPLRTGRPTETRMSDDFMPEPLRDGELDMHWDKPAELARRDDRHRLHDQAGAARNQQFNRRSKIPDDRPPRWSLPFASVFGACAVFLSDVKMWSHSTSGCQHYRTSAHCGVDMKSTPAARRPMWPAPARLRSRGSR